MIPLCEVGYILMSRINFTKLNGESDAVNKFHMLTFLAKILNILPARNDHRVMAVTHFSIIVT